MQYSAPNEIAESYCKNMIPGNYWIYSNQDNTKKDSLYFSYVPGEKQGEYIVEKMCAGWYQRIMRLYSTNLFTNSLEARYITGGVEGRTSLSIGERSFLGTFNLVFYPNKSECEFSFKDKRLKMNFIDSVSINGLTYNEVINIGDYYLIAPEVGLIQYVSFNLADTFYLEKFYKK